MSYQPNSHVNHILNDGSDSTTFHIVANGRIVLAKALLTDDAQQIVSKHACVQYEIIGRKFPGWQPLQIQIRLDFTVKLFAGAVIPV